MIGIAHRNFIDSCAGKMRTYHLVRGWEIPGEEDAEDELVDWQEERTSYLDPDYHRFCFGTESIEYEDADIELGKCTACLSYYAAMRLVGEAQCRAEDHQAKLDKVLRIEREFF